MPLNPLRLPRSVRCTASNHSFPALSRLHFANTLALIPFPRGLVHSMVRAYFGAKKTVSVRTDQLLTTASAPSGYGCSGPSYEAYTRCYPKKVGLDPPRLLARSKKKIFMFSDMVDVFNTGLLKCSVYIVKRRRWI